MPQPPKPTLLIVEDDPDQLFILELTAVRSGQFAHVISIRTVEEAIEHVVELSADKRPNLVLTDLRMPGMNGINLIEEFAKIEGLRDVPVVVISDSDLPSDRDASINAGAKGFFRKPADLSTLTKFMHTLREISAKHAVAA